MSLSKKANTRDETDAIIFTTACDQITAFLQNVPDTETRCLILKNVVERTGLPRIYLRPPYLPIDCLQHMLSFIDEPVTIWEHRLISRAWRRAVLISLKQFKNFYPDRFERGSLRYIVDLCPNLKVVHDDTDLHNIDVKKKKKGVCLKVSNFFFCHCSFCCCNFIH